MQRFNDEKGKNGKAQIQHQCSVVAFFDAINFLCAKILGNMFIVSGTNVVNLSPKALIFQGYRALFFLKNF